MSKDIRILPGESNNIEPPLSIEVDGDNGDMLEITIIEDRIYFDRFGDPKNNERQTMYYTFDDLLNKLKNEHG